MKINQKKGKTQSHLSAIYIVLKFLFHIMTRIVFSIKFMFLYIILKIKNKKIYPLLL